MICGESKAGNEEGLRLSPGCPRDRAAHSGMHCPSGQSSPELSCRPKRRREPLPTRYHQMSGSHIEGCGGICLGPSASFIPEDGASWCKAGSEGSWRGAPGSSALQLQPRCPQVSKDTAQGEAGSKPRAFHSCHQSGQQRWLLRSQFSHCAAWMTGLPGRACALRSPLATRAHPTPPTSSYLMVFSASQGQGKVQPGPCRPSGHSRSWQRGPL